jgi:hypothetical protein
MSRSMLCTVAEEMRGGWMLGHTLIRYSQFAHHSTDIGLGFSVLSRPVRESCFIALSRQVCISPNCSYIPLEATRPTNKTTLICPLPPSLIYSQLPSSSIYYSSRKFFHRSSNHFLSYAYLTFISTTRLVSDQAPGAQLVHILDPAGDCSLSRRISSSGQEAH